MNKHIGSDFDEFLRGEGLSSEVEAEAQKRVALLSLEEWTRELHRSVNDFTGIPHLSDEDLRRENMYEERL